MIRRLFRHLFTVFSILSLLLCLAITALWARSYWRCDEYNIITDEQWHFIGSDHGKIAFVRQRIVPAGKLKPRVQLHSWDWAAQKNAPKGYRMWSPYVSFCNPLYERFGFILGIRPPGVKGTKTSGYVIAIPFAFFVALTAILPAVWIYRGVRARRASRKGCCAKCGYDLRASPDRCPECGTQIQPAGAT